MNELLLEILIEEIPAAMQASAAANLKKLFADKLADYGIIVDISEHSTKVISEMEFCGDEERGSATYKDIRENRESRENVKGHSEMAFVECSATPRRLVLCAANLPTSTASVEEEKRGPKVGAPEQALQGFMRGNGIDDLNSLEQRDGYYYHTKTIPSKPLAEILEAELPTIINSIPWPKSMRWADGETPTFVRPIQNILCILGGKTLNFTFAGITSSNQTTGHDFTAPSTFTVQNFSQYKEELASRDVILNREERKEIIGQALSKAAASVDARLVPNPKLIDEVTGLVENPICIVGEFGAEFLELPREILEVTMAEHQRFFALEDGANKIINNFVGISNIADIKGNIKRGYEKVITARFNDARFYWDTDQNKPLVDFLPDLEKVVFHEKLGTLRQKTHRIKEITESLVGYVHNMDTKAAMRAAHLSKCDLVTGVIFEFPELQGIMGSYYADLSGEEEKVSNAIRWQYEHDNLEGLPPEAVCLIIADRIDTLVGMFATNNAPTGSKDPFALRRSALAIIRLLREYDIRISLTELIGTVHNFYGNITLELSEKETTEALLKFFMNRLQVILKEEGVAHDKVDAVFALGLDDVVDIARRASALQTFMEGADGSALFAAFKRASNILDKTEVTAKVEKSLLAEKAESDLFSCFEQTRIDVKKALESEAYERAMTTLTNLRSPLDTFFEDVLVMAEDEKVKNNRLALLAEMKELFQTIANFNNVNG